MRYVYNTRRNHKYWENSHMWQVLIKFTASCHLSKMMTLFTCSLYRLGSIPQWSMAVLTPVLISALYSVSLRTHTKAGPQQRVQIPLTEELPGTQWLPFRDSRCTWPASPAGVGRVWHSPSCTHFGAALTSPGIHLFKDTTETFPFNVVI